MNALAQSTERIALAPRAVGAPPTRYSSELAAEICDRLASGETLTAISSERDMPSVASWHRWLEAQPALREAYARARETQAHAYAYRIVEVGRTATDPAQGRLEMDSLKWAASKLMPRVYGDNLQLRHADADGEKLDTSPLVREFLGLMAPAIEGTAIDVTPKKKGAQVNGTQAPSEDIADLI